MNNHGKTQVQLGGAGNTQVMDSDVYSSAIGAAGFDAEGLQPEVFLAELQRVIDTMREQEGDVLERVEARVSVMKAKEQVEKGAWDKAIQFLNAAGPWFSTVAEQLASPQVLALVDRLPKL